METKKDIKSVLKADHEVVSRLMDQIEATDEKSPRKREELYTKFRNEIVLHTKTEERALYPIIKDIEETKDIALEAEQEHKVVDSLIAKIDAMKFDDESWGPTFKVMKENIEHHVEEEEGEMFEKMDKVFSKEYLQSLGENFEEVKKQLERHRSAA